MKNMKRWFLTLALTVTAALALSGCGGTVHWGHVHPHPPCAPEAPASDATE